MSEEQALPTHIKYVIIEDWNRQSLERRVNLLIPIGWIPQGGLAVYYDTQDNTTIYLQAMVRK